jgi:hypothetical protein
MTDMRSGVSNDLGRGEVEAQRRQKIGGRQRWRLSGGGRREVAAQVRIQRIIGGELSATIGAGREMRPQRVRGGGIYAIRA